MTLRANNSIQGEDLVGKQYKISLFAHDILLYITNPTIAFPTLLKEFRTFRCYKPFQNQRSKITLPKYLSSGGYPSFPLLIFFSFQ